MEVQYLQSLGMLTALQNLELYGPYSLHGPSGAAYTLKLPHLASLYCASFSGELVLSCPELLRARFSFTSLRRIMVEDAALEDLVLKDCNNVHVALAQDQLLKLKVLIVQECSEVGRHLIEEVSEMRNLRTLAYEPFPTACMPTSFPLSLREVFLFPCGWCRNLPEGLKGLQELRVFRFDTDTRFRCQSQWNITGSLSELLPLDSLDYLQVGYKVHILTCRGAYLENAWIRSGLGDTFATRWILPWRDPWFYRTGNGSCERPNLVEDHTY